MKLNKNNYDIAKIYQEMAIHLISYMKNNLSTNNNEERIDRYSCPLGKAKI